jgi:hypothetical protein
MHPMIRRQQAAQACIDRFAGKTYAPGRRDCVKLASLALRRMGHKVPLLKGLTWSSEIGALKALRRTGFATLSAAVDAQGLVRIAPAMALPCDLVGLPAEGEGFDVALMVAVGNGRVIGFSGGVGAVFQPLTVLCAWRA